MTETKNAEEWRRSRWGNWTREMYGLRLTVYASSNDNYRHCIASAMGPSYSRRSWPNEQAAMQAAERQLVDWFGRDVLAED